MLDNQDQNSDLLSPDTIISGRYRIVRFIGGGGMGNVYLSQDLLLEGDHVALKILHPEFSRDQDLIRRFFREVQLMHKVSHNNVVRTYDAGTDGIHTYFSMEYVSALSLDRCEIAGALDFGKIEELTCQICDGLQAIHDANIIHRDLKPGNILLLSDWSVKITDFGVARTTSSKITQHKEIIGSIGYMSPEILSGEELTPAVDFYSLGVILYELATGHLPFEAENPMGLMWMHVNKIPEPPSALRPEAPKWFDSLVTSLLEKNPSERPNSGYQVLRFLKQQKAVSIRNAIRSSQSKKVIRLTEIVSSEQEEELEAQTEQQDTSEEKPKKRSLRSACSAIIFNNFPTIDEMREQRKVARERKMTDSYGNHPAVEEKISKLKEKRAESREEEINELRRLQRYLFSAVSIVLILSVSTILYLLYREFTPKLSNSVTNENTLAKLQSFFGFSEDNSSWANSYFSKGPTPIIYGGQDRAPFSELRAANSKLKQLAAKSNFEDSNYRKKDFSNSTTYRADNPTTRRKTFFDKWYQEALRPKKIAAMQNTSGRPNSRAASESKSRSSVVNVPSPISLESIFKRYAYLDEGSLAEQASIDNDSISELATSYTEAQQAIFQEKQNIRSSIRRIDSQLENLSKDAAKDGSIPVETQITEVREATSALEREALDAQSHYNYWIDQQENYSSKGLTIAARTLSRIDKEVERAYHEYQSAYGHYLSMVEQDKLSRTEASSKAVGNAAEEMRSSKLHLEEIINSSLGKNLKLSRNNLLNLTYAIALSRERTELLKEQLRQKHSTKADEATNDRLMSELSERKNMLLERLDKLNKELAPKDELALKRLLSFSESL